ncbi:transposase [Pseudoalteromonas ardens]|uniref:transposase n=1 Tax=Pseudoalteromonas ardens TaxID=3048490 RepID=UPI000B1B7C63|nr:transposase [Pseudoalteromonas sp. R96]MDK1313651.1 transposase [Pseudoalteromonas sp. R96]
MSKTYSNEIKSLATKRVLFDGERVVDVAKDLEIGQSTLYSWIKAANQDDCSNGSLIVKSLKQRLNEVSEERDILIKAASIFAKELY